MLAPPFSFPISPRPSYCLLTFEAMSGFYWLLSSVVGFVIVAGAAGSQSQRLPYFQTWVGFMVGFVGLIMTVLDFSGIPVPGRSWPAAAFIIVVTGCAFLLTSWLGGPIIRLIWRVREAVKSLE